MIDDLVRAFWAVLAGGLLFLVWKFFRSTTEKDRAIFRNEVNDAIQKADERVYHMDIGELIKRANERIRRRGPPS